MVLGNDSVDWSTGCKGRGISFAPVLLVLAVSRGRRRRLSKREWLVDIAAVGATGTGSTPRKLTAELTRWCSRLRDDCRYLDLLVGDDNFIKYF